MRTSTVIPVCLALACLSMLLTAPSAPAQCGANTLGYGNLGIVKDNPFHAEVVITFTRQSPLADSLLRKPEFVARDSQGRIRIERVVGEYKHDTGAQAGTTAEQRLITICDPAAKTLTEVDTLNATAKIIHSRPSALNSLRPNDPNAPHFESRPVHTFCESRLMLGRPGRLGADDLGYQSIEGVQAHGVRTTMPAIVAASNEDTAVTGTTERWCSDDLSAIVLTVSGTSTSNSKTRIAMKRIERTEPDPSLFQIPPDYAITESVAEPHSPHAAMFAQP